MAFNQQLLMHNMTVKGKRLTSGMERFVQAVEKGEDVTGFAYHYALGCLGGDFISKKLMKTKWLPEVLDELVSKNLMKKEKGEKLKAEWKEKYVPDEELNHETRTYGDEVGVKSETQSTDTHPSSDLTPTASPYRPHNETACDEGNSGSVSKDVEKTEQTCQKTPADDIRAKDNPTIAPDVKNTPSETSDAKDEPTVAPSAQTQPEDADEPIALPITRISFVYDTKTKVCDYKETVPKVLLGLFYDLCDSRSVTGYFPHTIEFRGATWVRCPDESTNDANKVIVSYQISR